jgi:hypothetical protein
LPERAAAAITARPPEHERGAEDSADEVCRRFSRHSDLLLDDRLALVDHLKSSGGFGRPSRSQLIHKPTAMTRNVAPITSSASAA